MPGFAGAVVSVAGGHHSVGAGLSVATALFWAISPLCFASAGRRIGSWPVVVLRTLLAAGALGVLLVPYALVVRPATPTPGQVLWLVASGFTGMFIGDTLYYEALVRLGARRAAQAQVLSPVTAVLVGWAGLGEFPGQQGFAGMALVLIASSYAILRRPGQAAAAHEPAHITPRGVLIGVGAAVFVGLGAVLGRRAYQADPRGPGLDPVLATAVRVGASAAMFAVLPLVRGRARAMVGHLRDPHLASRIALGTLAGPVVGMLCYLMALGQMEAGMVSTLVALSPVFILPLIAVRYRVRVGWDIALAALAAAAGVGLIWLR